MKEPIAAELSERIRQRAPKGYGVLDGSLPVVSFDDMSRARVATLSLNPSDVEFAENGTWPLARKAPRVTK